MSRHRNRYSLTFLVALFPALSICSYAHVASAAWTQNGVLLSTGTGAEGLYGGAAIGDMRMVPDGAGGAYVFWADFSAGPFAQRVTSTGEIAPGWPADGVEIATGMSAGAFPEAISDGAGGVIVAWWTNPYQGKLLAQRLSPDGSLLWPESGVILTAGGTSAPVVATDGSGGAFVAWDINDNSGNNTGGDIAVTHIDANGALVTGWQQGGNIICPQSAHPIAPSIVPDGSGGVIIAWAELRDYPSWSIYAQKIGFDGTLDPAWPAAGRLACGALGERFYPMAIPDGDGGVLIAWADLRSQATNIDLYGQHIQFNGVLASGWTGSALAVSDEIGDQSDQTNPSPSQHVMTSDGELGAIFAWADTRNGGYDIYATRLDSHGNVTSGWTAGGQPVVDLSGQQQFPVIAPDGQGGVFIGWFDRRNGTDFDVYVLRLDEHGDRPNDWAGEGVVCAATGDQMPGAMCVDGAGGVIMAWRDFRRGDMDNPDIYAMRITPAGTSPAVSAPGTSRLSLAIHRVLPNPSVGPFTVSFRLASDAPAVLEWWDVSGRRALTREVRLGPGEHALNVDASGLSAGIYFVRLTQDERSVMARVAVTH